MNHHRTLARTLMALGLALGTAAAQPIPAVPHAWPDPPLTSWNAANGQIPSAGTVPDRAELERRCPPLELPTSPAARAIAAAGWVPFFYFDREIVADDVEVLAGMTGADPICRPMGYNLFVFVGGRFAGTLSPRPMDSRADLSSGVVRLLPHDAISVEITRYAASDPPCCPSSRDTVRFSIDRSQALAVVAPTEVRRTRGGK